MTTKQKRKKLRRSRISRALYSSINNFNILHNANDKILIARRVIAKFLDMGEGESEVRTAVEFLESVIAAEQERVAQ